MSFVSKSQIAGVVFATIGLAWMAPSIRAAEPERVKFLTFDQVEINGTFFPGSKGNKSPCALMLHALGGDSQQEGWEALAKKLSEKGYAVLAFDFRGHGESTSVGPAFWTLNRTNSSLRSSGGRQKDRISFKDFTSLYNLASPVNDIVAAKRYLDQRNDSGDCNSSNVVVVGAESGGVLGAMWVYDQWLRPHIQIGFGNIQASGEAPREGQDILCAVYLSILPDLSVGNKKYRVPLDTWMRTPVRDKVPMLFLYGKEDSRSANYAKHLYSSVLHGDKLKIDTYEKPIEETKLAGRELLGKASLKTDEIIDKYLTKVIETKRQNTWVRKDAERTKLMPFYVEKYLR
jgi:hypothetical protein